MTAGVQLGNFERAQLGNFEKGDRKDEIIHALVKM